MTPVYCKVALLLYIISSVYCDNVIPHNPLETQLLLLLKKWRIGQLDSSIIPLPSLRSIKIPDVSYYYDRKGIKMNYSLKKMELTGLDGFFIKELVALDTKNSLEMSIALNIQKLTLYSGDYELKGRAYLLYPLKGSGNMTVIFRNTDLNLKILFMNTDNGIGARIGDFSFDFNVRQIEANLTDSSWPINNVLNSEGVEILAGYHDNISESVLNYVVPYVDNYLVKVTTAQIVNSIMDTNL